MNEVNTNEAGLVMNIAHSKVKVVDPTVRIGILGVLDISAISCHNAFRRVDRELAARAETYETGEKETQFQTMPENKMLSPRIFGFFLGRI